MDTLPEKSQTRDDEIQWQRWREIEEVTSEQNGTASDYEFPPKQSRFIIDIVTSEAYASGHDFPKDIPFTD